MYGSTYANSYSDSMIQIDWSALSITLPDGLLFSPYIYFSTSASHSSPYSGYNGYSTSSAAATSELLTTYSETAAWGNDKVAYMSSGTSGKDYTYLLEGSGTGIISVSVPYSLSVDVSWDSADSYKRGQVSD
jgi:hypothetical protein